MNTNDEEEYTVQDYIKDLSDDMTKAAFLLVCMGWAVFTIYMWGPQIVSYFGR